MLDYFYKLFASKSLFVKQFIKFAIVGSSNTLVDFVIYIFLTRALGWHYMVAATAAFVVAVTWSFYFNRRWTFRAHVHRHSVRRQYARFVAANGLSLVLNLSLFYMIVDVYGVYDLFAKAGAGSIVALFNFNLNRLWTFASKDDC
jgi:putative flippase GtrA